MTAPLRTVKYREWRAGYVVLTLVCGHGAYATDDSSGVHCFECAQMTLV